MKRLLAALIGGFAAAAFTTMLLNYAVQPRAASTRRAENASTVDEISERDAEALLRELDSLS